jgi:DNA (cytosine-5)-methyltransferase 1
VFENVVGIWQRKNIHYMKNIAKEIMRLGYQVRCTVLRACDYGDPQTRPRFFMFIAKNNLPMPSFPSKTHGSGDMHLWPYVSVKDALSQLAYDSSLTNTNGRKTRLKPGQHGVLRLMPHRASPTILANGALPFHHEEDRCINVREAASLQSFPPWYHFEGDLSSQYRQVGNAVPVGLATAVAQCFRQVLLYEYSDIDAE